jgi:hypothetical protein
MVPYSSTMNLGGAYNAAMQTIPEDAWAIMIDHDAMLTTREWYRQFEEAIAVVPDAGAICAMTNRIAAPWQQIGNKLSHDVAYHRKFGTERLKVRTLLDVTETKGFGGVCFAVSKAAWRDAGGFKDGLLCVDHSLHFGLQKIGRRVWLHEGIYLYHWRRAFGDELPENTPRVANCPCRGDETMPTRRITLPERSTDDRATYVA